MGEIPPGFTMASKREQEIKKQVQKRNGEKYIYRRWVCNDQILREAGFEIGDEVEIITKNKKIIIQEKK